VLIFFPALSTPQRNARQDLVHAKMRLLAQQLKAERDLTKAPAKTFI